MMEPVWIAFSCGIFLGTCIGVLGLGLLYLNKDNKLMIELQDANDRIQELTTLREILKGEIFRLQPKNSSKSYRKIDEKICHDIVENLTTRFNDNLKVYVKS